MTAAAATGSRGEQLQLTLNALLSRLPEARLALAAGRDGLTIAVAGEVPAPRQEDMVAVAAARILDMAVDINGQLQQGDVGRVLIEGDSQTTIVVGAGRDIVLIVTLPAAAKLGLAMHTIRRTAADIAALYD